MRFIKYWLQWYRILRQYHHWSRREAVYYGAWLAKGGH